MSSDSATRGSEEYLALLSYVRKQNVGSLLSYAVVEDATGIRMDLRGRSKLRRAIERADNGCVCHRNCGYELASPENAVGIGTVHFVGIANATKRQSARLNRLVRQFVGALPPEDKTHLIFMDATVSALHQAAENSIKLYGVKRLPDGVQSVDADKPVLLPH